MFKHTKGYHNNNIHISSTYSRGDSSKGSIYTSISASLMLPPSPSKCHQSWDTGKCVKVVETDPRAACHLLQCLPPALFPSQLAGSLQDAIDTEAFYSPAEQTTVTQSCLHTWSGYISCTACTLWILCKAMQLGYCSYQGF